MPTCHLEEKVKIFDLQFENPLIPLLEVVRLVSETQLQFSENDTL